MAVPVGRCRGHGRCRLHSASTAGVAETARTPPAAGASATACVGGNGRPLSLRRTSAAPVGLRASLPLKITSSILSPRRLLALCSPSTHVMASATLLLPQPLGPTMAVTPPSKASSDRSEKDLKPAISRRSRRSYTCYRRLKHADTPETVAAGAREQTE